jgi:hypothetical protein
VPDRRGGNGSEERRVFRLLLTPDGGGWVVVGDKAAILVRPKSEKDMVE